MTERAELHQAMKLLGTPSVEIAAATGIDRSRLSLYWNSRCDLSVQERQKVADYLSGKLAERHRQLEAMLNREESIAPETVA